MARTDHADDLKVRKLPHIRELDGLRAVAIASVFIGHAEILPKFPGGFGVTIFFFLSGFLITTLLRIERSVSGTVSLKNFYIRRFLRINPPLWLTMLFIAFAGWLGAFLIEIDAFQITGQAFFFTNYIMMDGREGRLPIPLWSLAVEEHFYLVFPAMYLVLSRHLSSRQIAIFCGCLCLTVLGARFYSTQFLKDYYYV